MKRRYVLVSDDFCRLVGYEREELLGKRYDDLTDPETNDLLTVFNLSCQLARSFENSLGKSTKVSGTLWPTSTAAPPMPIKSAKANRTVSFSVSQEKTLSHPIDCVLTVSRQAHDSGVQSR